MRSDGAGAVIGRRRRAPTAPDDTPRPGDPELATTLRAFSDLRYRDVFWPARRYEDHADRIALRAFLPRTGGRLLEVGAGFGRLADEYGGFDAITLLDASEPLLEAARERVATDSRFTVVAGDAFRLPFPDASFDAAVCIRVVHHFADPRPAIAELGRVLRPGGVLVIESANRRNLRAVLAHVLLRRTPSPFGHGSISEAEAHPRPVPSDAAGGAGAQAPGPRWYSSSSYFHAPVDLRGWLEREGFTVSRPRSLGLFRLPFVTRHVPVSLLVAAERVAQPLLGPITPGPSVVFRAVRGDEAAVGRRRR